MKTKELWFGRLAVGLVASGLFAGDFLVSRGAAQVSLSMNVNIQSPTDFYSPLAPYGSWVSLPSYGQCWRPADMQPDWRPYTLGHWEWTDAGWYWASDEPWGWACFHYGQWVFDPTYGWVWLPGTEWAPAWVVWREAPDYIGWAPCGPGGVPISDTSFIFVDVHHFHDRLRPRELVFNDTGVLRRSRPVGGFRTETRDWGGRSRRIAINQGPGVEPIQRATGTRFSQRPVRELVQQTPAPAGARRTGQRTQPPYVAQQPAPESPARTQQRLYREAPPTQPAPTGRQEPRIYREAPNTQPAQQTPPSGRQERQNYRQVPAPQPQPQPVPQPPPTGRQEPRAYRKRPTPQPMPQPVIPPTTSERGRPETQVPRRSEEPPRAAEPAPRVAPAAPPQAPAAPPPNGPSRREGRDRERDGGQ